jgi:hypothetical protein
MHTISGTLVNGFLAATTSDADPVDDETLLRLVSETSSLVGTGRAGSAVDHIQLPVLPAADPKKESKNIGLLLALQL